jgi:hypothetical protein
MSSVTWGDDELPIRVFQIALRLSTHFLTRIEPLQPTDGSDLGPIDLLTLIDNELQNACAGLRDKPYEAYRVEMRKRLKILSAGESYQQIVRGMAADLDAPFECEKRLLELNRRGLEMVKRCVEKWGGEEAQGRASELKPLRLHCETPMEASPILFFDRRKKGLLLRAGSTKDVLWEGIILQFSLFHEYLSHYFPTWTEDHEEISEGYLFAVEWEWFQSEYLPFDIDLLQHQWNTRLQANRPRFRFAQWLLRRQCPERRECAARFLLEWVAGWRNFPKALHDDLSSQISGVANKLLTRMVKFRPKDEALLRRLEDVICSSCGTGKWEFPSVRDELAKALEAFAPPT